MGTKRFRKPDLWWNEQMGELLQEVVVELSVQRGEELWGQGKERAKRVVGVLPGAKLRQSMEARKSMVRWRNL